MPDNGRAGGVSSQGFSSMNSLQVTALDRLLERALVAELDELAERLRDLVEQETSRAR